jgi:hypothetical protein
MNDGALFPTAGSGTSLFIVVSFFLHEGIKTRIRETAIAIKESLANVLPAKHADPFIYLLFLLIRHKHRSFFCIPP